MNHLDLSLAVLHNETSCVLARGKKKNRWNREGRPIQTGPAFGIREISSRTGGGGIEVWRRIVVKALGENKALQSVSRGTILLLGAF